MKTIKDFASQEFIIQKSKFIVKIFPLEKKEDIDNYINKMKQEFKDATHICYAYIFDNFKKFNDDGEPGGTAGMPMLYVLEQNNLSNVLAVIIRYFGGIKLGASGLFRAYSNSLAQTINDNNIVNTVPGLIVELVYDYANSKQIENLLQSFDKLNKKFDDKITITFKISLKEYQNINTILSQLCISIKEIKPINLIK